MWHNHSRSQSTTEPCACGTTTHLPRALLSHAHVAQPLTCACCTTTHLPRAPLSHAHVAQPFTYPERHCGMRMWHNHSPSQGTTAACACGPTTHLPERHCGTRMWPNHSRSRRTAFDLKLICVFKPAQSHLEQSKSTSSAQLSSVSIPRDDSRRLMAWRKPEVLTDF